MRPMNTVLPRSPVAPVAFTPAHLDNTVFGNKVGNVGGHASSWQVASAPVTGSSAARDPSGQLRQHINSCRRSAGPMHHVHCFLDLMYETVATRLVTTTVLLLAALLAIHVAV